MRVQRFRGATILNELPFGRALQAFARGQLPAFLNATGFGFNDGGCLMFAEALVAWSEGDLELAAVYGPRGGVQAHHVVAVLEGDIPLYLDSDGVGTEQDILLKMAQWEHLANGYIDGYGPENQGSIPFDVDLTAGLSRKMSRKFGVFSRERLVPFEPLAAPAPGRLDF